MKRILIALVLVAGLSACAPDADEQIEADIRQQRICDSMENYRSNDPNEAVIRRNYNCDAPADPYAVPAALPTEPELSPKEKYQRAYEREREVEAMSTDGVTYPYGQGQSEGRVEYFKLYLDALPGFPEAHTDLERAFDKLFKEQFAVTDPADYYRSAGINSLENILMEAWDAGKVDKTVLRPMLVRVRDKLVALKRARGFNSNTRYLFPRDWGRFANTGFGDYSDTIADLYDRTDPNSTAARRWRLQALDYVHYFHSGDTESSGERERSYTSWASAYKEYTRLGYPADAKVMAYRIIDASLDDFVYGAGVSWEPGPTGEPRHLERARKWYDKVSAAEKRKLLIGAAKSAERLERFAVAATLYQELGDTVNAKRMKALAQS